MRKTITVCDFEHTPDNDYVAEGSYSFVAGETIYYIDLCADHCTQFQAFQELQQRWVRSSRTEQDPDAPAIGKAPKTQRRSNADTAAIRAWAVANHLDVSARGRLSPHVIRQWEAAGSPRLSSVAPVPEEPQPVEPTHPAHPAANRSFLRR